MEEIASTYSFSSTNCVADTAPSCDKSMTISASVVASGGNYTTSSSGTCSHDSGATLAWADEPTDWADLWLAVKQDCISVNKDVCRSDGIVRTMLNQQFTISPTKWPSWSGGSCSACGVGFPLNREEDYLALNPDCSENNLEDLTWYNYNTAGENFCNSGTGCIVDPACAECGRYRSDRYNTSLPSLYNTASRTCTEIGWEHPDLTLVVV